MIFRLAYLPIFGYPLIAWDGLLTLLLFFTVAFIGYCKFHGKLPKLSFYWHPSMAVIALTSAVIHAILGLSIYFKF